MGSCEIATKGRCEKFGVFPKKRVILASTLVFLSITIQASSGIQWLALSKFSAVGSGSASDNGSPDQMCNSMKGSLIKKQVSFCKRNPTFMESVRLGAARAIDECQFQFRSRRWNCSTLDDSIGKKMALITTSLNGLTHGESSNKHKGGAGGLNGLHLPSSSHGGFNPNNGLNPFSNPYMHNSLSYRPNNNYQQRSSNERSSRQVQQAFNRNRNVRRGRRLSRRARHGGLNGSSNTHSEDEVTNDTRMVNNANPVQQTAPASSSQLQSSKKLVKSPQSSSVLPSWRPPLKHSSNHGSIMGPGIPLNSFDSYGINLADLNLDQVMEDDEDDD